MRNEKINKYLINIKVNCEEKRRKIVEKEIQITVNKWKGIERQTTIKPKKKVRVK